MVGWVLETEWYEATNGDLQVKGGWEDGWRLKVGGKMACRKGWMYGRGQ